MTGADSEPVDVRASLARLARRLEEAHEASPGDAALAQALLAALIALRAPGPEVF